MPKRNFNIDAPYQSIKRTAYLTGLSSGSIREGCKSGRIPHIMVGKEYRVDVPQFLALLAEESQAACTDTEGR